MLGVNYFAVLNNFDLFIFRFRKGILFVSRIDKEVGDKFSIETTNVYNKQWYKAKREQYKMLNKDDTDFLNDCAAIDIPIYAKCRANQNSIIPFQRDKEKIFIFTKDGNAAKEFKPAFYDVGVSYLNVFHVFKYVLIKAIFHLINLGILAYMSDYLKLLGYVLLTL